MRSENTVEKQLDRKRREQHQRRLDHPQGEYAGQVKPVRTPDLQQSADVMPIRPVPSPRSFLFSLLFIFCHAVIAVGGRHRATQSTHFPSRENANTVVAPYFG